MKRFFPTLALALMLASSSTEAASTTSRKKAARTMPSQESIDRAKQLLDTYKVIDGHNDLPWSLREHVKNDLRKFDFTANLTQVEPWKSDPYSHTDLPRIREGRLGGQFWSAYVGCDSQYKDAVQLFLEQIDVVKRLAAEYPDDLAFCRTAQEVEDAVAGNRVASLIGVESGHAINSNLGVLRLLHELGARYMTLTHGCNTPWADAAQVEEGAFAARSNGLSDFGEKVILEMNRLGMFVDISHVTADAMKDALRVTKAPVIFSHSSARAICSKARNVPDDVLEMMIENRGVVMVNLYSDFLNDDPEAASLQDAVDHINHIRSVCGSDCVGLGADYNGVARLPPELSDVSTYPVLFAALIESEDAEWSVDDLQKLAQGNILRAMREMEAAALSLSEARPQEDRLEEAQWREGETGCMSEIGGVDESNNSASLATASLSLLLAAALVVRRI